MDKLSTLNDRVLLRFCLSLISDKSKYEERKVAGKHAGSDLSELADASNISKDSHGIDNRSSEDESDDDFSMASEAPLQGQGNSTPEGAVSPNPHNEVINPTIRGNGKPIVIEEARSKFLNLNRSMSGRSELNQPINPYPTLNNAIALVPDPESDYQILDDAFSPSSSMI